MDRKLEGVMQVIFSIAVVAAILAFSDEIESLKDFGYVGAFLIALLGSATIVLPSPAFAAIIAMAAFMDPVMLGLVAGIGSGMGELTGYVAGHGGRNLINNRIKESRQIESFVRRYDIAAIFILSFIPNPLFDIAGLVAGGLKMHWVNFLAACILGRVLRYVLLALVGAFTLSLLA